MARLDEDTLADKAVRFVIGAFIGGASGYFVIGRTDTDAAFLRSVVIGAVVVGVLAVVLGNRFIEWVLRHQRLP